MSEMIERVAKALFDNRNNDWPDMSRAAIEAMREPTPEMIEAGLEAAKSIHIFDDNIIAIWNAMNDTALSRNGK